MKRTVSIILFIMVLSGCAFAESIGEMTYDELILFQQEITYEIISRPEFNMVLIPSGSWIIGKDIPEGQYSAWAVDMCHMSAYDTDGKLRWSEGLWDENKLDSFNLIDGWTIALKGYMILSTPKE